MTATSTVKTNRISTAVYRTIKGQKYGFNRPAARSAAMMGTCGQRAVLGANLAKLVRGLAGGAAMAAAK